MDYQIQPNSRRCTVTGRELQPGERFFSALLEEDRQLVRKDYSQEAWQGAPPDAVSFWTGHVLVGNEKQKPRFDDDLLEDCFQRLEGQTEPGREPIGGRIPVILGMLPGRVEARVDPRIDAQPIDAGFAAAGSENPVAQSNSCLLNWPQFRPIAPPLRLPLWRSRQPLRRSLCTPKTTNFGGVNPWLK